MQRCDVFQVKGTGFILNWMMSLGFKKKIVFCFPADIRNQAGLNETWKDLTDNVNGFDAIISVNKI